MKHYILGFLACVGLSTLGWISLQDTWNKNIDIINTKKGQVVVSPDSDNVTPLSDNCKNLPKRWWRNESCNSIVFASEFKVDGKTIGDRMKELLRMAHPGWTEVEVNDIYDIFRSSARVTGVKKEIGFCIAYADTGLGRSKTTEFNWGNVGNTDSGARKKYTSHEAGIFAIYSTVKNQYLGRATNIKQLSLFARGDEYPTKKFYASGKHWFGNTMNCLKLLTNDYDITDYLIYWKPGI